MPSWLCLLCNELEPVQAAAGVIQRDRLQSQLYGRVEWLYWRTYPREPDQRSKCGHSRLQLHSRLMYPSLLQQRLVGHSWAVLAALNCGFLNLCSIITPVLIFPYQTLLNSGCSSRSEMSSSFARRSIRAMLNSSLHSICTFLTSSIIDSTLLAMNCSKSINSFTSCGGGSSYP